MNAYAKLGPVIKNLILVAAATICSCAFSGEISEIYFKNIRTKPNATLVSRTVGDAAVTFTNHGVTEIGIERCPCFGTCPVYTFVAKSDGSFRYKGEKYAERQGVFTGTISTWQFNHLAQFIKDSGYMQLSSTYTREVTDNPTTFTMVVMNGRQKVISNYANAGPTKLWAIEQLIDNLLAKATWDELPKTKANPN